MLKQENNEVTVKDNEMKVTEITKKKFKEKRKKIKRQGNIAMKIEKIIHNFHKEKQQN